MILRALNRATTTAQLAENLQRLHDTDDKYGNLIE